MKICSKTHHLKNVLGEACPRTPLINAWLQPVIVYIILSKKHPYSDYYNDYPYVASRFAACNSPSPTKSWVLPLANPAYAHALLLRNLFEEICS